MLKKKRSYQFIVFFIALLFIGSPSAYSQEAEEDPIQEFLGQVRGGANGVTLPRLLYEKIEKLQISSREMGFVVYRRQDGEYAIPIVEGGGFGVDVYYYEYQPGFINVIPIGIMVHTHPPPDDNPQRMYTAQVFSGGGGMAATPGTYGDIGLFLSSNELVSILKTESHMYMLVKPANWQRPSAEVITGAIANYSVILRSIASAVTDSLRRRAREKTAIKIMTMQLGVYLYYADSSSSSTFELIAGPGSR